MTPPDTSAAVSVRNVDKMYRGKIHALRGVDIDVHPGEVFGLLGPNGAGKSTLIKILMTVIRPTRCQGHMLGKPIGHKPTLTRVGYLPEHHAFPPYLTGRQVLNFYGSLAGATTNDRRKRTEKLLELVNMTRWGDTKVSRYSKGMRQRVGIAQALMNDPDLILLDEPTDGVDPVGRKDIRDIVKRLSDQGKAVFVNSHILSELEMVTDRVAIMVQGQVASFGTIDQLTEGKRFYEINADPEHRERIESALTEELNAQPAPPPEHANLPDTVTTLSITRNSQPIPVALAGASIRLYTEDPAPANEIFAALHRRGVPVLTMRPVRPSLEDLFIAAVTDLETGETHGPGAADERRKPRRHKNKPPQPTTNNPTNTTNTTPNGGDTQ